MVLNLDNFSCRLNALVFDLGSLDMVFGMEWLKTLGEVLHNWKEHSMRSKHENRWVELTANTFPADSLVPLKVWFDGHVKGWYRQLDVSKSLLEPSLIEQQQNQLSAVLQSFAHLFSEPQGLPPT